LGGGSNWWGGSSDPERGWVYVSSSTSPGVIGLVKNDPPATPLAPGTFGAPDYVSRGAAPFPTIGAGTGGARGLSILKPPYGRITAYDMNKGVIAWQVANGDTPAAVKSNPLLQGLNIPKTGTNRNVGILVTKTLLFAGDGTDPLFDAYDKETGQVIAQLPMPGMQTGVPMTYMLQGRQFILVSVGAANGQGPQLVAYALPQAAPAAGARGARGARGQ